MCYPLIGRRQGRHRRAPLWNWSYGWLWATACMLGTNHRSSAGAACVLNCWAFPWAPSVSYVKCNFCILDTLSASLQTASAVEEGWHFPGGHRNEGSWPALLQTQVNFQSMVPICCHLMDPVPWVCVPVDGTCVLLFSALLLKVQKSL